MPEKESKNGEDARHCMIKGVNILADATRETLGPLSQTVVVEKSYRVQTETKDGVSRAMEGD